MANLIQGMFLVLLIKMELKALVLLMFMSPIESVHAVVAQPRVHAEGISVRPTLIKPATVKERPHEKSAFSGGVF